jgi:hypothetical protein
LPYATDEGLSALFSRQIAEQIQLCFNRETHKKTIGLIITKYDVFAMFSMFEQVREKVY